MSNPGFEIVVIHPNGDRKTLPVEYVAPSGSYLTVRWEAAGTYDLSLSKNTLMPSDCKTISKGTSKARWYRKSAPLWKAEDIEKVRKLVAKHNAANTSNETEKAIRKHVESMPK